MKYKVSFYMDDTYEVYRFNDDERESCFLGSLSDCEAWIRLTESGKM